MKAVIFDMDGVIIDSEPVYNGIHEKMLRDFGVKEILDVPEDYTGMTNSAVFKIVREKYNLKQTVEEISAYQLKVILEEFSRLEDEPIDGIRDLLALLKEQQIKTAIASSSARKLIETVVKKFNLMAFFDVIVSGEEVPAGKPAPDVFLEAARQLHVSPENCLVIEDSKNGTIAAKAAGMSCIGFKNPNSGNQDLSRADNVVLSIRDIHKTLSDPLQS